MNLTRDGTTDITRTFHFGTPTAKQKVSNTGTHMCNHDIHCTFYPFIWLCFYFSSNEIKLPKVKVRSQPL